MMTPLGYSTFTYWLVFSGLPSLGNDAIRLEKSPCCSWPNVGPLGREWWLFVVIMCPVCAETRKKTTKAACRVKKECSATELIRSAFCIQLNDQPVTRLRRQRSDRRWKGREGTRWEWSDRKGNSAGDLSSILFPPVFTLSSIREPVCRLTCDLFWEKMFRKTGKSKC